jgi:hypothetical protein
MRGWGLNLGGLPYNTKPHHWRGRASRKFGLYLNWWVVIHLYLRVNPRQSQEKSAVGALGDSCLNGGRSAPPRVQCSKHRTQRRHRQRKITAVLGALCHQSAVSTLSTNTQSQHHSAFTTITVPVRLAATFQVGSVVLVPAATEPAKCVRT